MNHGRARIRRQASRHDATSMAGCTGPLSPTLDCQLVRDQGFSLLGTRVLDVSETGMQVALDAAERDAERLECGESVWVSFHAGNVGMWFDFEAEVVRVVRGRRPGDRGASVGLRFRARYEGGQAPSSPALTRLYLRGGIARLPVTPASPDARRRHLL